MRIVNLAILASSISIAQCLHGQGSHIMVALYTPMSGSQRSLSVVKPALPETLIPAQVTESETSVKGPISSNSSSSVSKTEDMSWMVAKDGGAKESQKATGEDPAESNSVLTDSGTADQVHKTDDDAERDGAVQGLVQWDVQDIAMPKCKNCKALIDYKWVVTESALAANSFASISILSIALCVLIWVLGTTAQDFFVPPLIYWADKLQLSPEIAGATLLALGNCSPDMFSIATAAHKGDLPLGLSELLGANMFMLCITGGVICLIPAFISPHATAELEQGVSTARLVGTAAIYGLAMGMLGWLVFTSNPTLLKACCLPAVYALYLFMLWYLRDDSSTSLAHSHGPAASSDSTSGPAADESQGGNCPDAPVCKQPLAGLARPKDGSPLETTCWLLGLPSYIVRWGCIPPVDAQWDSTRRLISSIAPLGMLIFCISCDVFSMQHLNIVSLLGITMLACLAGAATFIGSDSQNVLPWFYPALPMFALVASMIWLAVLASEITAIVEAMGFSMQVPRLQLGFTAIAWGNSISDFLVIIATVRQGHAVMAITAVFAGPLMDDLIAFGAALFVVSAERGIPVICGPGCPTDFKFPLMTSITCIIVAAGVLCFTIKNRGSRSIRICACIGLISLYVAFLILVLFVEHVDAPVEEMQVAGTTKV